MHAMTRPSNESQTEKISLALFDTDGFIHNPELWDKEMAKYIANNENIVKLSQKHWLIINFVRQYYLEKGAPPLMRQVCRQLKLSKYQTAGLFSCCLQVWKIAGLTNPGDEARGHLH